MVDYLVRLVGQPRQPEVAVEASSAAMAVALTAGCRFTDVCLPIWRQGPDAWHEHYAEECFMPLDDSGRQWIVTKP